VSLFVVLVLATAGVVASWVVRDQGRIGHLVGLVALAVTVVGVAAIPPGDAIEVTGIAFVSTPFARMMLTLLASAGLLLSGIAAVAGEQRSPAVAWLATVAAGLICLTTASPVPGSWAILAAAAIGLALPIAGLAGRDVVAVLLTSLTALAIGAIVVVVAMAGGTAQLAMLEPDPGIVGLAFVGVAVAVAVRGAVVPFHRWAPPIADVSSGPIVAALVGALPALAAILAISWLDQEVTPLLLPLDVAQAIVLVTVLGAMILSALAAWIQDDLGHMTVYLLGHGTAVTLLGIAAVDPAAWAPTRTWALASVAAAAALLGWLTVMEGRYRSRRLSDLRGWVRRSPLLAFVLAIAALAMIGVPGMAVMEARVALAGLAENPLASLVATVGIVAPLLAIGRVLAIGIDVPSAAVRTAPEERPHRPAGRLDLGLLRTTAAANRAPLASVMALVLALGAALVSTGAFDLAAAAAGDPPAEPVVVSSTPGDQPEVGSIAGASSTP
jgi:formate hydrogenlyase subunit 3/multisubunit Na+/H+ antiporter MnhD subunit